jgi:WD40 repeat protein
MKGRSRALRSAVLCAFLFGCGCRGAVSSLSATAPKQPVRYIDQRFSPTGLAVFGPQCRTLAVRSSDELTIVDAVSGTVRIRLPGKRAPITWLAASRDRDVVAGLTSDGALAAWSYRGGQLQGPYPRPTRGALVLALHPAGRLVASHGDDRTIELTDLQNGRRVGSLSGEQVMALAFSPDGRQLAAAGRDGGRLWLAQEGAAGPAGWAHPVPGATIPAPRAGTWIHALAFDEQGALLALRSGRDVALWEVAERRTRWSVTIDRAAAEGVAFSTAPAAVVLPAEGRPLLLALSNGAALELFPKAVRMPGPISTCNADGERGTNYSAAVGPGGGSEPVGNTDALALWQSRFPNRLREISGLSQPTGSLAWSSDGHKLAADIYGSRTLIWELQKGEVELDVRDRAPVAWAHNDGWLVTQSAVVWDAKTGARLSSETNRMTATSAACSCSALWQPDGSIRILPDPSSASPVVTLPAAERGSRALFAELAFTADGKGLAAAAADGSLRFWTLDPAVPPVTVVPRSPTEDWQASRIHFSFTADGQALIVVRDKREVLVWDVAKRELRERIQLHAPIAPLRGTETEEAVRFLSGAVRPGGAWLAAAGNGIDLIRVADRQALHLFAVENEGRWEALVFDDAGRFDGGQAAASRMRYFLGATPLDAEVIDGSRFDFYRRISLLTDSLRGSTPPPAATQPLLLSPPSIAFEGDDAVVYATKHPVRMTVNSAGGGVGEIRVFVNAKREDTSAWTSRQPSASTIELRGEVTLDPGPNVVTADAFDASGTVLGRPATRRLTLPRLAADRPDLYLVTLALDHYADPTQTLHHAIDDERAVQAMFRAQEGRLFQHVNVIPVGPEASVGPAAFEAAVAKVAVRAQPRDVFVFYAAGHGDLVTCAPAAGPSYRLLGHRSSLRDVASICEHGVSAEGMMQAFRTIAARKKLVLLDTCKSGAAATSGYLVGFRGSTEHEVLRRLSESEGIAVATAATPREFEAEIPQLGHGLFTAAVLRVMAGLASRREATVVTAWDVLRGTHAEMPELARKYLGRAVYPVIAMEGQDYPIAWIDAH